MDKKTVDIFGTRDHIVNLIRKYTKIKVFHAALLYWIEQKSNKSYWSETIYFPTEESMASSGFTNWRTYKKTLDELVELKLIEIVEESKNIYSPCIIRPLFFKYKNNNGNAEAGQNGNNPTKPPEHKDIEITAELLQTINTYILEDKIQIDSIDKKVLFEYSEDYLLKSIEINKDFKEELSDAIDEIIKVNPNLFTK